DLPLQLPPSPCGDKDNVRLALPSRMCQALMAVFPTSSVGLLIQPPEEDCSRIGQTFSSHTGRTSGLPFCSVIECGHKGLWSVFRRIFPVRPIPLSEILLVSCVEKPAPILPLFGHLCLLYFWATTCMSQFPTFTVSLADLGHSIPRDLASS